MKYQRFVSLTALLSFIIIFVSSGVLYFIPDRSVTSWSGWNFLGLDKQQWDNLHINLGILFLIMLVWHIYFNWKPIKNYLKVKKELKIFTKEFNVALIVVSIFFIGTITMTLPFSFLINIGNGIKALNSSKNVNPPFAYAEYATLDDFILLAGIDKRVAVKKLETRDIKVSSYKDTLKKIALENGLTPKDIFLTIKSDKSKFFLPSALPVGIAHKSFKELADRYKFDIDKFKNYLKKYDIEIKKDMKFKKVAKKNNLHPAQLYNILLASQVKREN
jgi:uncharacterized membrane protein